LPLINAFGSCDEEEEKMRIRITRHAIAGIAASQVPAIAFSLYSMPSMKQALGFYVLQGLARTTVAVGSIICGRPEGFMVFTPEVVGYTIGDYLSRMYCHKSDSPQEIKASDLERMCESSEKGTIDANVRWYL
jgi:hypothetical protein